MSISSILSSSSFKEMLILCKLSSTTRLNLLYRGSEHGFTSNAFHQTCDGHPKVLILIKSISGNIFGGYSSKGWDSANLGYSNDEYAFLFSLVNKEHSPFLIKCSMPDYAIYYDSNYGPIFGAGMDLSIITNSNVTCENTGRLGYSYKHPFYDDSSEEARYFLAGSYYFRIEEIDIFKIF